MLRHDISDVSMALLLEFLPQLESCKSLNTLMLMMQNTTGVSMASLIRFRSTLKSLVSHSIRWWCWCTIHQVSQWHLWLDSFRHSKVLSVTQYTDANDAQYIRCLNSISDRIPSDTRKPCQSLDMLMLMLLPQHVHPLDSKLAKLTGDEDVATAHDDEDPGKPQQVVYLLCRRAGQGTIIVFCRQLHSAVGLQAWNKLCLLHVPLSSTWPSVN